MMLLDALLALALSLATLSSLQGLTTAVLVANVDVARISSAKIQLLTLQSHFAYAQREGAFLPSVYSDICSQSVGSWLDTWCSESAAVLATEGVSAITCLTATGARMVLHPNASVNLSCASSAEGTINVVQHWSTGL